MIRDLLVAFIIILMPYCGHANPTNKFAAAIEKYKAAQRAQAPTTKIAPKITVSKPVCLADLPEAPPADSLYGIVQKLAPAGLHPAVMYAIQQHETGCYKSSLWRRARNPGGIKYRKFPDIDSGKTGVYCSFATAEDGIKAHAIVLSAPRYRAARETNDPVQQVVAIGNGGYAEYSPSWTSQVSRRVMKLLGLTPKKKKRVRMLVD